MSATDSSQAPSSLSSTSNHVVSSSSMSGSVQHRVASSHPTSEEDPIQPTRSSMSSSDITGDHNNIAHHHHDPEQTIPILNHHDNLLNPSSGKAVKAFSMSWLERISNSWCCQIVPRIGRNLLRKCFGVKSLTKVPFLERFVFPYQKIIVISFLCLLSFWILYAIMMSGGPKSLYAIYRNDKKNSRLVGYVVQTNTNPSFYLRVLNPNRDVGFSKHLVEYGNWETATEELFGMLIASFKEESKKTRKRCLVVDIGAFAGFYTILPALHGCRVIAYEIQPQMAGIVMSSASLNDIDKLVTVKNLAVWKEAGTRIEYSKKYVADLTNVVTAPFDTDETTPDSVETITLDEDYFSTDTHINLLKVDVSKKTDDIFLGALRTLSYMIDNIIVELTADDAPSIRHILDSFFDKVVILEDSKGLASFFFKSSTPKIFVGEKISVDDIVSHLRTTGKRNVWFSKTSKTIPYYGV
ncbi:hypothetical protein C9374_001067 [Naegleria lovaniensis]|uniref:Methyltransferase FkbM domain-containing protein n=1 Tax=Naegleria lovaniensis TaxID=51637 RepID=A0AA88GWB1_NAELO|nr:uncharacterized protein C9374_001067 [Naegleria lovaniensis]KAG2388217.1 hypothetical protein C9374_001067 [Naegleria lovaniensis]